MTEKNAAQDEGDKTVDTQILELSTVLPTDAAMVEVDGVLYSFAQRTSWGLIQRTAFTRCITRIDELEKVARPTKKNEKEYKEIGQTLVTMLVPSLPTDTSKKLTLEQRGAILATFLANASGQTMAAMNAARELTKALQTGA